MINWGTEYFSEKKFENPRVEIEWLLSDFLACKRIDLYVRFEEPLTSKMLTEFRERIKRRVNREPLQYISGKTEFYGLPLLVNSNVLIPRPETERVVETAVKTAEAFEKPRILEVGTGSGCIAVAMAKELPTSEIVTVDISSEALKVASENALLNDVDNIQFSTMDILTEIPSGKFDLLVSNPPYITKSEMGGLMRDVVKYEPQLALTDKGDGLVFYRRFSEIAPAIVESGGWIILELGHGDQPPNAAELFNNDKFRNVELIRDYNGDDRVLKVQMV